MRTRSWYCAHSSTKRNTVTLDNYRLLRAPGARYVAASVELCRYEYHRCDNFTVPWRTRFCLSRGIGMERYERMSVDYMLFRTYSMKQAQNDHISFLHKTEGWTARAPNISSWRSSRDIEKALSGTGKPVPGTTSFGPSHAMPLTPHLPSRGSYV
jgi:hypothetical protein